MALQAIYTHKRRSFSSSRFNKKGYFFFNHAERLHQVLGYGMPYEVYLGYTASKKYVELGNLNGKIAKQPC